MNREIASRVDNRHIRTTENNSDSFGETLLIGISCLILIIIFPISMWFCLYVMNEYQRAVVFRLGRLRKGSPFGPGIIFINPFVDAFVSVDLRTTSFDVPPQDILTKDSVTIKVDAVVYYRLNEPVKAIIQVDNVNKATNLLAQTTLRNVVGTKMLNELLTSKEELSASIGHILDEATDRWGVKVERVEIKDIRLPMSLQRNLAAEAEAIREAHAKVVAAEGEMTASKALKEASDIMAQNSMTLQLRCLQTMAHVSTENNSTIVFPFPIDLCDFDFVQAAATLSTTNS